MSSPNKPIGGYFELELPQVFSEKYPSALKYQSARAAFSALLQRMPNIKRVWMPSYICDTMFAPLSTAGKELALYNITEWFTVEHPIQLAADELLLYVNYFGICSRNVLDILKRYPPQQIVIDCSQAFYSGPFKCLATIYSPRKFFGVPDGGLLITNQTMIPPTQQDKDSMKRCGHLLQRLAFSAEDGLESYRNAERSLNDPTPKGMSQLTQRILSSISHPAIKKRRKANFTYIDSILSQSNTLTIKTKSIAALCYPYLPNKPIDKSSLAKKRIYIPTYWPDVLTRAPAVSFEYFAASRILAIPCDQRYTEDDLARLLKELTHELHT